MGLFGESLDDQLSALRRHFNAPEPAWRVPRWMLDQESEIDALKAVLRELVDDKAALERGQIGAGQTECWDYRDCRYCDAMSEIGDPLTHKPDCPILRGQQLLGQ